MRGTPETWAKLPPMKDAIGGILHDLEAGIHRAVSSGVDHLRMVIDPGLGFGKRREQNAEILARLSQLGSLELPVMVGPSRKSFLGTNLGAKPDESDMEFATAAAVTAAVLGGAHIVRIHDVVKMKSVLQIADAVLAASIAPEPIAAKPPPLP